MGALGAEVSRPTLLGQNVACPARRDIPAHLAPAGWGPFRADEHGTAQLGTARRARLRRETSSLSSARLGWCCVTREDGRRPNIKIARRTHARTGWQAGRLAADTPPCARHSSRDESALGRGRPAAAAQLRAPLGPIAGAARIAQAVPAAPTGRLQFDSIRPDSTRPGPAGRLRAHSKRRHLRTCCRSPARHRARSAFVRSGQGRPCVCLRVCVHARLARITRQAREHINKWRSRWPAGRQIEEMSPGGRPRLCPLVCAAGDPDARASRPASWWFARV
jgi:hypothetical protein